jgi:hypothetical protein
MSHDTSRENQEEPIHSLPILADFGWNATLPIAKLGWSFVVWRCLEGLVTIVTGGEE